MTDSCEYCKQYGEKNFGIEEDGIVFLCMNYNTFKNRKKVWHIVSLPNEGESVHSAKINFCPMCGRKLSEAK